MISCQTDWKTCLEGSPNASEPGPCRSLTHWLEIALLGFSTRSAGSRNGSLEDRLGNFFRSHSRTFIATLQPRLRRGPICWCSFSRERITSVTSPPFADRVKLTTTRIHQREHTSTLSMFGLLVEFRYLGISLIGRRKLVPKLAAP